MACTGALATDVVLSGRINGGTASGTSGIGA